MVNAIIKTNSNGDYTGFKVSGHAGYKERMNTKMDLVCASVSVLVINTVNALEELTDIGMKVEADEVKGIINCQFTDIPNEKEAILVEAMVLGLREIEKQYGKLFCKLSFEEV